MVENCFVAVMEIIFKFVLAARYVIIEGEVVFVCDECTLLVVDGGWLCGCAISSWWWGEGLLRIGNLFDVS